MLLSAAALVLLLLQPPGSHAGYDGAHVGASLLKDVAHAPCVRLFSSQGTTGCRTPSHEGTTAPLYHLAGFGAADQQAFLRLDKGVAVVMSASMLNATVLDFLASHAPARTQGVIVLEEESATATFPSPDVPTPQGQGTPSAAFTIGPTHAWNPAGSGLVMQKYDFPVVLATAAGEGKGDGAAQVKAWAQHNGGLDRQGPYPRYKAVFKFYFGPSSSSSSAEPLTSADCLGWKDVEGNLVPQCLPMGGQSVWASLGGRTGLQSKPTVLLTAAMDGVSLFHDKTPAANEAVASILTLLAATSALHNASLSGKIDLNIAPNNLAVAFFQADEWGFAGSRRFVRDISPGGFTCASPIPGNQSRDGTGACMGPQGVYPSLAFQDLTLEKFAHVLAVDQVGVLPAAAAAAVPLTALYNGAPPTALLQALASATTSLGIDSTASITPLDGAGSMPPTPFTSFLREAPGMSGVVLAGYGKGGGAAAGAEFIDPRYHSHMDKGSFLDAASLTTVATLVARTAWSLASGGEEGMEGIVVQQEFIEEFLTCLTEDWNCPAMKPYREAERASLKNYLGWSHVYSPPVPTPPNYYSGVLASYQGLALTQHTMEGGSSGIFAAWPAEEVFVPSKEDKFYVVPKPLEAFLKGWLAYTLGGGGKAAPAANIPCKASEDCDGLQCDNNLSTRECFIDTCICRTASFYHTALDPGLAPQPEPGIFTILDKNTPNYAEPNWANIGLAVFPDTSARVEGAALGVGFGVVAVSAMGAWFVQRALVKHHYFD